MNNDPTQNNNNNNNNGNNNNGDNNFNSNISKYYWKLEKMIHFFHNFESAIAAKGVICYPRVRKGVIKLQQIICKHNQAHIPTAI